jgi:hypothetical protein
MGGGGGHYFCQKGVDFWVSGILERVDKGVIFSGEWLCNGGASGGAPGQRKADKFIRVWAEGVLLVRF